jgi:hypothetical protein
VDRGNLSLDDAELRGRGLFPRKMARDSRVRCHLSANAGQREQVFSRQPAQQPDTSPDVRNKLGWAFGLGLERIAMILYSIPDIRLFWSQDARFLTQFKQGDITTFRPYSKYPACFKDVSFWLPENMDLHDNDFCDLVRDVAGDIVEDVKMVRVSYASFFRNLTHNRRTASPMQRRVGRAFVTE